MDIALTLHADHELNASTFAARVAAATLTDIHSAIVAGIGTLKGPLHGGANAEVMKMLIEIGQDAPAERIDAFVKGKFARKEKISGFGHRVYNTEDPRATHLRKMSKELGQKAGNTRWFEMSERIEALVKAEKKLYPERRLLLGVDVLHDGHRDRSLHADLRGEPHHRLDRARAGATGQQPPDPAARRLHRAVLSADLDPARSAVDRRMLAELCRVRLAIVPDGVCRPLFVGDSAAAPATQSALRQALSRRDWNGAKTNFRRSADVMPEAKYGFKPGRRRPQLTARSSRTSPAPAYEFCAAAKGEKTPHAEDEFEKSATTKAAIVKALDGAIAYCDGSLQGAWTM